MSGSLPHRQLRKCSPQGRNHDPRSPPHRQLRKDNAVVIGERAVRCRTGSLEIIERHGEDEFNVRCRTGSLEKDVSAPRRDPFAAAQAALKCRLKSKTRIGAFAAAQAAERDRPQRLGHPGVRCRTGSLEIAPPKPTLIGSSLPHRQLRKNAPVRNGVHPGSLPHRQLRKACAGAGAGASCSLPHRQLRKDQIQQLVDDLVRCRTGSLEKSPRPGSGRGAFAAAQAA